MPPKRTTKPGGEAAVFKERTNTEGRDINYQRRQFTSDESNFFLYRTVFLYVCFGIHGIEPILETNIQELLALNRYGTITDRQVKKMCWVVYHFEEYLHDSASYDEFIFKLSACPDDPDLGTMNNPNTFAKSIATLAVRVFVAFQMRINIGNEPDSTPSVSGLPSGVPATSGTDVLTRDKIPEIQTTITNELSVMTAHELNTKIDEEVKSKAEEAIANIQTIIPTEKIEESIEYTRRSDRVQLLNAALAAKAEERARILRDDRDRVEQIKQKKLEEDKRRLNECIQKFGTTINFIKEIQYSIFSGSFPSDQFNLTEFYKLLPKLLARVSSCIEKRISLTEVKAGPGTVDTLNALGLPDPTMKMIDEEDDPDGQGGGNSGKNRNRIFGITKRKKKNKILRKLKNKKVGRNLFYGGAGRKVSVRTYVEHTQAIPQCESTIGNYHKYVSPSCYICGEPWIEGVQKSMECEHILCVIHGVEYYGLLQTVFITEENKNFLSILYAWAHRCCNQRKKNIAFIRKNSKPDDEVRARGNYFIPDDMNIRGLLTDIYTLSAYAESKNKFDCNKIFKKGKNVNKPQFVEKRTAIVTNYVSPLVDCVNRLFTGNFASNMFLFNAIGCLKIIAEMCIYLTADKKSDPSLKLDITKTFNFMKDVVFPGCTEERASTSAAGAAPKSFKKNGGANAHNETTRKLSRHKNKIQRGGAQPNLLDHFSGLFGQETYEEECKYLKNETMDNTLTNPRVLDLLRTIPDDSINEAILFILFVLNHYRNPSVLLGLFLELSKPIPEIIGHEIREQHGEIPENGDSIRRSFQQYQELREIQKSAFTNVCVKLVENNDIMHIVIDFFMNYYTALMPSLFGVLNFCGILESFPVSKKFELLYTLKKILRPQRQRHQILEKFDTNVRVFQDISEFDIDENATPKSALDHFMNACVHLHNIPFNDHNPHLHSSKINRTPYNLLEKAFELFPSCYHVEDNDFSSKFGACNAYKNVFGTSAAGFQKTLGSIASAHEMCVIMRDSPVEYTNTGRYTQEDAGKALELFACFFDEDDKEILYSCISSLKSRKSSFVESKDTPPQLVKTGYSLFNFYQGLTEYYDEMCTSEPHNTKYGKISRELYKIQEQEKGLIEADQSNQIRILIEIINIILKHSIQTEGSSSQLSAYETSGSQSPEKFSDAQMQNVVRSIMLAYNSGHRLNIKEIVDYIIESLGVRRVDSAAATKRTVREGVHSQSPPPIKTRGESDDNGDNGDNGGGGAADDSDEFREFQYGGTSNKNKKRHHHRNTHRRIKQKIKSKSRKTKKNRKL